MTDYKALKYHKKETVEKKENKVTEKVAILSVFSGVLGIYSDRAVLRLIISDIQMRRKRKAIPYGSSNKTREDESWEEDVRYSSIR